MDPSVGIAVPVRNGAPFIADTLQSLRALTVPFEAIVQDGHSTDDTLAIVDDVVGQDPRFRIIQEADEGQADALNRALRPLAQRHPFVTWVNADDILHPHGFSRALQLASTTPAAAAVYGAFLTIDVDGLVIELVRRPARLRRAELLYVDSLVPGVATICRSDAMAAAGWFDPSLTYALDTDLFIRLSAHGRLIGVPQPTFSFRVHESSKTTGTTADLSRAEAREVARRHRRLPEPAAAAASLALRGLYRLRKMAGSILPVERYGDQTTHEQP